MNSRSPSVTIQIVTSTGLPVLRPKVVSLTSLWRTAASITSLVKVVTSPATAAEPECFPRENGLSPHREEPARGHAAGGQRLGPSSHPISRAHIKRVGRAVGQPSNDGRLGGRRSTDRHHLGDDGSAVHPHREGRDCRASVPDRSRPPHGPNP